MQLVLLRIVYYFTFADYCAVLSCRTIDVVWWSLRCSILFYSVWTPNDF